MDKPRVVELKTWKEFFKPIEDGVKSWEIRNNDRNFQVGDMLILWEYDKETQKYTGRFLIRRVTLVAENLPWLQSGYVCMSIIPVSTTVINPESNQ
jgi:predicted RNA-binding protein with PUA-like domain